MIKFTKMHGAGNDYVYVNCFETNITNPKELAVKISDRHFGVGSDGLVLILPSNVADFKMSMFNADGSEGKMCGNAIRCVAKYVYDNKMTDKTTINIETLSGIKTLVLTVENNEVTWVSVDMGMAELNTAKIPVLYSKEKMINEAIEVDGQTYYITCVSMGNPHAVIFTEGIDGLDLEKIGPFFENHKIFPERVNTEFVEIVPPSNSEPSRRKDMQLRVRVWERGSGETLACGTGACAVVVAAVLNGYCEREKDITVKLRGGDLIINYHNNQTVTMTGGATKVFDGEYYN